MTAMLAIASICMLGLATANTNLVAPYLLYYVNTGDDFDVLLKGFVSLNSPKKFNFRALSTVSNGALYLPSHNYCKYGYEPSKRGAQVTAPTDLNCHSPALLYNFPASKVLPKGELDRFSFSIDSTTHGTSCPGVVHFVDAGDPLLVASEFLTDAEGWTLTGNSRSSTAVWDKSSIGSQVNRYVHGTEGWIDLDAGRTDRALWFFNAPSKFLGISIAGGMAGAYGGTLRFVLSSASGDFSAGHLNSGHDGTADTLPVVRIDCATCRNEGILDPDAPGSCQDGDRPIRRDQGIQLIFPLSALTHQFDGSTTEISIVLNEKSGWLKDSENSQVSWCRPTQNEFIQVLKRFSGLSILGDYTRHYESILLDTVRLEPVLGSRGSVLPESAHQFMHFEDQC